MDTLYAREAAEEARHQTLEDRLEQAEEERDKALAEVKRLRKIMDECLEIIRLHHQRWGKP